MTGTLQQQRDCSVPAGVETTQPVEGLWPTIAALTGSLAIASVPLFSGSQTLSLIPQALALLTACLALSLLAKGIPSIHPAIIVHGLLVAFWGITLLEHPDAWQEYQTLLKVTLMGLAAHIVFRSPKHLTLLFAVYTVTGIAALAMNWDELRRLGGAVGTELSDRDRFAGSFANANSAGIYGVMLILSGIITFLNLRSKLRWLLASLGILAGIAIFFFSGSRKGMLGLAFILAMLPWLAASGAGSIARFTARASGIGMVVVAAGVILVLTVPFVDRLIVPFTQGAAAESSSEYRMAMLTRAIDLWTQHPLLGCGFEGFARMSEFGVYSHSTPSEVLCNGGLLGMALIGVFYGLPAWQLARLALGRRAGFQSAGAAERFDKMPLCLLAFWGVFSIFSLFAVLYDSREFVPIYAGVCGYIMSRRSKVAGELRGGMP